MRFAILIVIIFKAHFFDCLFQFFSGFSFGQQPSHVHGSFQKSLLFLRSVSQTSMFHQHESYGNIFFVVLFCGHISTTVLEYLKLNLTLIY